MTTGTTMSGSTTTTPSSPRQGEPTLASSTPGTGTTPGAGAQVQQMPSGNRGTAGNAPSTGSSASNPSMNLNDDQILYVLHTANIGEMEQAKVAEKKAKDARVKRFAAMMQKDHGDADSRVSDVAKRANASMAPSEVSARLDQSAKENNVALNTDKGKDFDRSYINAQVSQHRALLDSIDHDLLPAATSTEVRELVQAMRTKIESHLREAQDIAKGISNK
jgi:putative membrane protein